MPAQHQNNKLPTSLTYTKSFAAKVHRAGEKLFADYAGQTMPIINPDTGEVR